MTLLKELRGAVLSWAGVVAFVFGLLVLATSVIFTFDLLVGSGVVFLGIALGLFAIAAWRRSKRRPASRDIRER
jgi:hypothetical protein